MRFPYILYIWAITYNTAFIFSSLKIKQTQFLDVSTKGTECYIHSVKNLCNQGASMTHFHSFPIISYY